MNTPDYDKISRYIDDEMDAGERKSFEEQLQHDAELRKETELYKEINDTLKYKLQADEEEKGLRNTLEEMNDLHFGSKAKIIPLKKYRLWIASAAAIAVIAVLTMLWAPWKKDLYKQYAYIEMPPVAERGVPADSLLKQGTSNFNEKKFKAASSSFEAILKNDPQNAYVQFYYAIALLESGQIEESRTEFTGLYNGASLFKYDAAFYMALSYLKEKNKTACREWLNKIPADANIHNKAQKLLKKL
jgi:cytochrome c-type biogenesis protein CcmH/NrfG